MNDEGTRSRTHFVALASAAKTKKKLKKCNWCNFFGGKNRRFFKNNPDGHEKIISLDFIGGFMKTDNSTIITFFNIYITCREKRINVEIIYLISNVYIIEGMCRKKSFKKFLHVM